MSSPLLDRVSIRVQDESGGWSATNVREATDRQFHDWATLWFHNRLGRYIDLGPLQTSPEERESVLRLMVEQGFEVSGLPWEQGSPMAEVQQFQPRDRAEIISGSLKGQEVTVLAASSSLEGFYDCVYHKSTGSGHKRTEVTLGGSQLKLVKPGNGGANG